MLKHWIILRTLHILIDILGVLGAFFLAYFVRVGWIFSTDFDFTPYAYASILATLTWIGFLGFAKYYRIPPRSGKRVFFDLALILCGGIIASSFLVIIYFFNQELFFSRLINIYIIVFGVSFLLISQWVFRFLLMWQKSRNLFLYQTLIIGANPVAAKLIEAIDKNPYAPHHIVGVIDPYGLHKTIKGSTILGKLDRLDAACKKHKVNCMIQCDAYEHTLNMISFCEEKNIKYQFDPALRGVFEENLRIRYIADQTMISFVKRDFESKNKRFQYKIVDGVLRQIFDVD